MSGEVSPTVLAIVGGYLLLSLVVGVAASKRSSDTATGFVAGDRALGTLVMYFITGATIFSAFAFLGAPGTAYSQGGRCFYILAFGTLGFVPFYFYGPRAARLGRAYGFVTQAEMVATRFRMPVLAGVMALVATLAFVPYLALQMKGAGYVLSAATGGLVSVELGAGITYTVVLVYVLASGVLGVGWTNTLQGVFMMGLAWFLGLWIPHQLHGGVGEMFRALEAERPGFVTAPGLAKDGSPWLFSEYSSYVLVSTIGFSCWPHLFMKAFTAKSEATLRRTVVLYPTFQLFVVPILIVGFAGVLFESAPAAPDQILPHLLLNIELPEALVGLFCAGALAASMSSGDAIAHASASILVRDGYVTTFGRDLSPETQRLWIRVAVVAVMIAAYTMAVTSDQSIVALLLLAYGPVVQFAPGVIATLFSRRATGAGVLAGIVVGIGVNVLFALKPDLRPAALHAGIWGLAANVATLALVSARTRGAQDEHDRRFLAVAAGERDPS